MMVNYYKGNTTGEFLDYYEDCLEDDEKTEEIKNIYDKLNNLHKCFTAFVCLNFIGIFLNALGSCFKEKKWLNIIKIYIFKKKEKQRTLI